MCLLVLAWKVHPRFDLVVAANRDEQHARPTWPLDRWIDHPGLLAGRDLVAAGTWLAVHEDGRFAAVTNFRDERPPSPAAPSRGELITRYLASTDSPARHAARLEARAGDYAGFNLLLGDAGELWYLSNRAEVFARPLEAGIHALSNHLLGTSWPKVEAGLAAMREHVDAGRDGFDGLFAAMALRDAPAPSALPWPASSGPFIEQAHFGTRSSSVLCREPGRFALLEERRFGPSGAAAGATRLALPLASAAA